MRNQCKDELDFQVVYYDFYLKARWAVMNKEGNKRPYFEEMFSISPTDDLLTILEHLKEKMESHSYEFSLGSNFFIREIHSLLYMTGRCEYICRRRKMWIFGGK